jgi:glycosyltransferase involved in cell wall biosynthesis
MGYVPEIGALLASCRIMVAPLRFGAGIKGKIGEAMAAGLPVVTTTIGAEGFGLTHLVNVLIADDALAFAHAAAELYSTKEFWESIAENGRHHIETYFTPMVVGETINRSIRGTEVQEWPKVISEARSTVHTTR